MHQSLLENLLATLDGSSSETSDKFARSDFRGPFIALARAENSSKRRSEISPRDLRFADLSRHRHRRRPRNAQRLREEREGCGDAAAGESRERGGAQLLLVVPKRARVVLNMARAALIRAKGSFGAGAPADTQPDKSGTDAGPSSSSSSSSSPCPPPIQEVKNALKKLPPI